MRTWITKDKQEIPIAEMSDHHLLNAFRMVSRMADWMKCHEICMAQNFADSLNGEMAQDCMEGNVERLRNTSLEYFDPRYRDLEREINKRKLKP